MMRAFSVAIMMAAIATVAYAKSAAIEQRQDAMDAIADASKVPGGMLKGEVPFDLAKVQASLTTYQKQLAKMKDLWPDDSKVGDTRALPAVWEKRAEFLGLVDKFLDDSKAASAAIKDEASLKSEWPKLMLNCVGCHREYRRPGCFSQCWEIGQLSSCRTRRKPPLRPRG